jgi:hypothetical protein
MVITSVLFAAPMLCLAVMGTIATPMYFWPNKRCCPVMFRVKRNLNATLPGVEFLIEPGGIIACLKIVHAVRNHSRAVAVC